MVTKHVCIDVHRRLVWDFSDFSISAPLPGRLADKTWFIRAGLAQAEAKR